MKPSAAVYIAMPQNVSPNAIGFGHIKQSILSFFGRRTIAVVHTSKRDYAAIIQRILKSEVKRDDDAVVLPAPTAPAKQYSDIRTCLPNLWRTDVIIGGFPCQDVSNMGKRRGLAGERTGLFYNAVDIIDTLQPRWVVLENVVGLLSSNHGEDFQEVIKTLANIGYLGFWRVLNARYFGVPTNRRRVFIFAGLGEYPPLDIMGDARPMGDVSQPVEKSQSTKPFPTLLAGLNSGTSIDLGCSNIIAVPNAWHKMVERWRASEDYGFCRGLDATNFEETRASGNAICPPVSRWIAEKLIKTY